MSSESQNHLPGREQPDENYAVREAMTYALASLVNGEEPTEDEDMEMFLERVTLKHCNEACFQTLFFLRTKFPDLFRSMYLIYGTESVNNHFKDRPWDEDRYHGMFVVEGKNGIFYAGSPANYVAGERHEEGNSRLTYFYEEPDLETLLSSISYRAHGNWPTSEFILSQMGECDDPSVAYDYKKRYSGMIYASIGVDSFTWQSDGTQLYERLNSGIMAVGVSPHKAKCPIRFIKYPPTPIRET